MPTRADVERMTEIIRRVRVDYDVEVREMAGWQSRGANWARVPVGIIDHHDASSRKSGEWGALGIIVEGRPGVPGPLSQFQIARCLDGRPRLAVVAAGRANHAGLGGPLPGIPQNTGNSYLYGAEAANDGLGEPYTDAAHYAHDALFRAVADVCRFPAARVFGHREWAPGRKSDPRYDMGWRRSRVAVIGRSGSPAPAPTPDPPAPKPAPRTEEDDVMDIEIRPAADGSFRRAVKVEAGAGSATGYGSAYLALTPQWGDADVIVTALGERGPLWQFNAGVTGDRAIPLRLPRDHHWVEKLPDGTRTVAIEGTVGAGEVAAAVYHVR
jgi:hypothetical protein